MIRERNGAIAKCAVVPFLFAHDPLVGVFEFLQFRGPAHQNIKSNNFDSKLGKAKSRTCALIRLRWCRFLSCRCFFRSPQSCCKIRNFWRADAAASGLKTVAAKQNHKIRRLIFHDVVRVRPNTRLESHPQIHKYQDGDEMILSAQPIGVPPSRRFVIQNLDDAKVWNGKAFVEDWDEGRKYATASDACADMADIQRDFYGALPKRRFVCPVEIEVYGNCSRVKIARYLHRASTLNVKTDEYGNGPGECLILPTIHFGLVKEIEDVPMLSKVENWVEDKEDEFGLEDEDDK